VLSVQLGFGLVSHLLWVMREFRYARCRRTAAGQLLISSGKAEPRQAQQVADLWTDPQLRPEDQRVGRSAGRGFLS
jgi:hypothetical protein